MGEKYANSPHAVKKSEADQPIFGHSMFEKRKTLKIKSYESNSSKLPNMSDVIDSYEGGDGMDEFVAYCSKTAKKMKSNNSLPPVNEFDDTKEEKRKHSLLSNDEDEKTPSHNPQNSRSLSSSTMTFDDMNTFNDYVPATYACTDNNMNTNEYVASSHKQMSSVDEDKIEKLLRKVCGSSYNKYKSANAKMGNEQRHRLKMEIAGHMDNVVTDMKQKYELHLKEKDMLSTKHRRESLQWQQKYKALKKQIKEKKLKHAQNKQKSAEGEMEGCKFWSWGFQPEWIANSLPSVGFGSGAVAKECNAKKSPIFVDDDSEDIESSHHTFN